MSNGVVWDTDILYGKSNADSNSGVVWDQEAMRSPEDIAVHPNTAEVIPPVQPQIDPNLPQTNGVVWDKSTLPAQTHAEMNMSDPMYEEKNRFRTWYRTLNQTLPHLGNRPEDIRAAYLRSTNTPMDDQAFNETLLEEMNRKKKMSEAEQAAFLRSRKSWDVTRFPRELIKESIPWVAAGAGATLAVGAGVASAPAWITAGGALALYKGAEGVYERWRYGREAQKREGFFGRTLSGAGSWLDPRAESEMSEQAAIARDVLDTFTWMGGGSAVKMGVKEIGTIAHQFKLGAESLGAAARRDYPLIHAGLIEAQTWYKKNIQHRSEVITDALWNKFNSALNKRFIPTSEKMYEHGSISTYKMKKSLNEIFQPAIERVKSEALDIFRDSSALRSNLANWGQEIGGVLAKEADPFVRFEIEKGLRGTPLNELKTTRAKQVVGEYMDKLSQFKMLPKYEAKFKESIGKALGSKLETPEEVFLGDEFSKLLDPIAQKVGKAKVANFINDVLPLNNQVKVLQKGLKELIEDPSIPYQFQTAAKDLYNLPSTIPEEVFKAADSLVHSMLTRNLRGMKNMVLAKSPQETIRDLKATLAQGGLSPKQQQNIVNTIEEISKTDYIPSTWKSFITNGKKSKWVQRDVELELKAIQEIPEYSNRAFNKYFMTPWKIGKIMLRPAAVLRNTLTNEMLNHMGGLPIWRQDIYRNAYLGMRGSNEKFMGQKLSSLWQDYSRQVGATTSMDAAELHHISQLSFGSNMRDTILHKFNTIVSPAKTFYTSQENYAKFAKYLHNLEKGMNTRQAAYDAMKWTFNYGEVTRGTAMMRTYVAPFFTWQSKVFPLFAESVIKHPLKWGGAVLLYKGMQDAAISAAGMTSGEYEEFKQKLPDYIQNGMMFPLPWRDERGRLQLLDLTYLIPGFGDAFQMSGHPYSQLMQQPLIGIAAALYSNKKFSGAPISYDWEDPVVKAAKSFSYVWEQLVPAPMIGGTDFKKMYQAFVQTPMSEYGPLMNDLSRTQAISSFLGAKILPLDEGNVQASYAGKRRAELNEVRTALRNQMKNIRDPRQAEEAVEKYLRYSQQIATPEQDQDERDWDEW